MASEDDVDLQTSQRRVASTALEVLQAKRKLEELVCDVRAIEQSKDSRLRSLWSVLRSLVGKGPPSLPIVEDPIESAKRFAKVILPAFETPEVRAIVTSFELLVASRQTETPLVSIVIPGVNQVALTLRCLQSIADVWVDSFSVEIIVIDDASSDESTRVLGAHSRHRRYKEYGATRYGALSQSWYRTCVRPIRLFSEERYRRD